MKWINKIYNEEVIKAIETLDGNILLLTKRKDYEKGLYKTVNDEIIEGYLRTCIRKYSKSGSELWTHKLPWNAIDLAEGEDGSLYFASTSTIADRQIDYYHDYDDIYYTVPVINKTNAFGELITSKEYVSNYFDGDRNIKWTALSKTRNNKIFASTGRQLCIIDSELNIIWLGNSSKITLVRALVGTEDGAMVVCSLGDAFGNSRSALVIHDEFGNIKWHVDLNLSPFNFEDFSSIVKTRDNNILLIGTSHDLTDCLLNTKDVSATLVHFINKNGQTIWRRKYPVRGADDGVDAVEYNDGFALLIKEDSPPPGNPSWFGLVKPKIPPESNMYVLLVNKYGDFEAAASIGGTLKDVPKFIFKTDTGLIIVGFSDSYDGEFGEKDRYARKTVIFEIKVSLS